MVLVEFSGFFPPNYPRCILWIREGGKVLLSECGGGGDDETFKVA